MFGRKWLLLVMGLVLFIQACSSCVSRDAAPSGKNSVAATPSATDDSSKTRLKNRENIPGAAAAGIRIDLLPVAERASIADSLVEMMKQIKENQRKRGTLHNATPLRE